SRPYTLLHEQSQDVTVAAGDLLADDHVWSSAKGGCVVGGPQRALDRVVVGDRDHIKIAHSDKVIYHGAGAGPAVAVARVNVEVRSAEPGHLQRSYRSAELGCLRVLPTCQHVPNGPSFEDRSGGNRHMKGLMQDYPLTVQHMLWRVERLFDKKEIVSKREDRLHRYTYTDLGRRTHQLANVLTRLGVKQGDRVATLAWNNYRHLELYYAIPCMGAVLHTLNLRLFPDQLEFTISDAGDSVLFVDKTLIPVLNQVAGRIPSVRSIVVMNDGGPLPEHNLGELLDYETLMSAEKQDFSWPKLDE